ncbi:sugar phosphate isomerase/epimerase [Candidatus Woesearchaeota archaeon]|nr:sugar phosphate isomerase/epimerase [Candidatus Woesearchaeota archaeon]
MVEFSSYVTPMDRDYGKPTIDEPSTNDIGIGIQDIGQGVPMGIAAQNVQGVAAKLKTGAGSLEIQFPGAGTGQRQAQTPGMYGEEQRQALREIAEINEINLTTHAGFGVMGLAGMDQRSGNFSKEQKKTSVDEIKRAIEFAADTAKGGSVVVHTGEFQRPISEEEWARDPAGKQQFAAYEEEPEEAVVRVVDRRTGQVMTQVRKNQKVPRPIWRTTDEKPKHPGNEYINYEDKVVGIENRVPEYDPSTGRFKVELKGWQDFEAEARERNEDLARQKGLSVTQLQIQHPSEYVEPEEAFLQATLEANEGHARGWALQYAQGFEQQKKNLEKMKKALIFYEKLETATPESERWKLSMKVPGPLSEAGLTPSEYKTPTEIINKAINDTKKSMEYEHEASVSQEQLAAESRESRENVASVKKYALTESFDSYAQAGIYAYDQTRAKKLEKPVFVTMENIYPESYGGHPRELMNLIENSRKKMAEKLVHDRKIDPSQAKKLAETHIKATLDTGHLNTWRKYWQNDPNKTTQDNDAAFKKWMLNEVETMAKKGMVGNVHLADNYGYQDEHLTPGDGTTPIKEMVAILKKHGYEGALTVEPGAAATTDVSDFHGLMKTWKLFGSPVYGAHGAVGRTDKPKENWGSIQYSYFGQTTPPYFIFGPYSPSQDWSLWSQVPME